jgi:signal peptidase I
MMFEGWNHSRHQRRARSEARHLIDEARGILRRKREEIPDAVHRDIEGAIAEVEGALASEDLDSSREALGKLDEKIDEHLKFARKSSLREYIESIGVAVTIALLLRAFVVEAFQIPSGSMIPTLEVGDHIFVSKFAYGIGIPFTNKKVLKYGQPKRGDIIVFKFPHQQEIDYIKRVVALPGEKVEIRRNEIFINGRPMPREEVKGPCTYEDSAPIDGRRREIPCEKWMEDLDGRRHSLYQSPDSGPTDRPAFEVPANHVFVMGDNRDNANDSRVWGAVNEELIKGRALIVWWSRGPTSGEVSAGGLKEWFQAIRWSRFFSLVR